MTNGARFSDRRLPIRHNETEACEAKIKNDPAFQVKMWLNVERTS